MTSRREFIGLTAGALADTTMGALAWWQGLSAERRQNARSWPTRKQEKAAIERLKSAG
jgi:hypothetical protein